MFKHFPYCSASPAAFQIFLASFSIVYIKKCFVENKFIGPERFCRLALPRIVLVQSLFDISCISDVETAIFTAKKDIYIIIHTT